MQNKSNLSLWIAAFVNICIWGGMKTGEQRLKKTARQQLKYHAETHDLKQV